MSSLFEAQDKVSAVDTVINRIKQLLIEKKLKPGERLPSEVEICQGLGISRGSVREAMKILSALGIVEIKVGNGTFISEKPNRSMIDSLLFSFLVSNPDISEMSEFRKLIELDIVELIIKNSDKNAAEIAELKNNVEEYNRMIDDNSSLEDIAEKDIEFHRILARASHNTISERIYNFVIDILEPSIKVTHIHNPDRTVASDIHKKIIDSIESKNINTVQEAIDYSVEVWSNLQDSNK